MMNTDTQEFRVSASIPPADQLWTLFQSTGWNEEYHLRQSEFVEAVRVSWYCVGVYDRDTLVGFGRIVSDGVLHAMIYDLIVLPSYQGRGIGSRMLDLLVGKCRDIGIRDIQLFCADGKKQFYEKRGFLQRAESAPGMEYRKD